MSIRNRSRGITLIGFVMLLAVLGFFAYLAMRLVPMYIEYMGVVKAMEQVRAEPGCGQHVARAGAPFTAVQVQYAVRRRVTPFRRRPSR